MADGRRLDSFLRELPSLLEQADRHLHCDNVNILENVRRRLDDYYVAVRAILQHCMEQEDCHDLLVILREIHDRLFRLLEQYHRLCNFSMEGDGPLECNVGHSFVTQEPSARGRRRLEIDEETLSELHSIYYAWSAVACETGVSYLTILRRRHELGFPIANRAGPRNTFCNITDDDLCNVVREVLQNMPDAGETYIIGAIRSRGMIVQRWRIRQAIQTVDPISRALRRTFAVVRRVYNVVCPNELW